MLDDNGTFITDSHAICAYLTEKYADSDRLYPKDLVKRALVNARLHFNSGHLFSRLRMLVEPVLYMGSSDWPKERVEYIQSQWDILNRFLEKGPYVCGDEMTIADFCLVATASSLNEIAPMDPVEHSKILEWIDRMAQLSYYEELNGAPARNFQAAVISVRQTNESL